VSTPGLASKTLFALDDGVDISSVEHSLPSGPSIQNVGVVEGVDAAWRALEESSPDLLVVVVARFSERALFLIEAASKQRPDVPVVVLYQGPPDEFMRRAFEAGADDLLTLPDSPERLRFALEKAVARRRGTGVAAAQAPMVSILGPKGGTGKTLTACNLTVAFAKAGKRSALVDLDLQFGDVGIALGLSPDRTIYDLVRSGGSIDAEKLAGFLTPHSSGANVLLGPTRPDQAGLISVEFIRTILKALRASHDVVVIDTPPAFSPEVIAAIDAASHLCMVGALDALSLKDSKLGLETLELMGHKGRKVRFVLNRADGGGGISRRDAETILGRTPDAFIPEDKDIVRGVTEGLPIVLANERSVAARAFTDLAKEYVKEFDASERSASGAIEATAALNGTPKAKRSLTATLLGRGAN
jgi:pilus assembly protein CpaE